MNNFHQTFEIADLAVVAVLVGLEALLSADNAIVLALTVKHLPEREQKRALLYGLGGGFAFRLIAIMAASFFMRQWWLQAAGAAYFVWLPIGHWIGRGKPRGPAPKGSFWRTVVVVELMDAAFAADSVLAGIAVIRGDTAKIWVVYLGGIVGIALLRFAAVALIRLLERFARLEVVAYGIVGWMGIDLAMEAAHIYGLAVPEMPPVAFWSVMLAIGAVGSWLATRAGGKSAPRPQAGDEPV